METTSSSPGQEEQTVPVSTPHHPAPDAELSSVWPQTLTPTPTAHQPELSVGQVRTGAYAPNLQPADTHNPQMLSSVVRTHLALEQCRRETAGRHFFWVFAVASCHVRLLKPAVSECLVGVSLDSCEPAGFLS